MCAHLERCPNIRLNVKRKLQNNLFNMIAFAAIFKKEIYDLVQNRNLLE